MENGLRDQETVLEDTTTCGGVIVIAYTIT